MDLIDVFVLSEGINNTQLTMILAVKHHGRCIVRTMHPPLGKHAQSMFLAKRHFCQGGSPLLVKPVQNRILAKTCPAAGSVPWRLIARNEGSALPGDRPVVTEGPFGPFWGLSPFGSNRRKQGFRHVGSIERSGKAVATKGSMTGESCVSRRVFT